MRKSIAERIVAQMTWMRARGWSLSGYIALYGSAKDPGHYGDGGEAIYAADHAELVALRQLAGK